MSQVLLPFRIVVRVFGFDRLIQALQQCGNFAFHGRLFTCTPRVLPVRYEDEVMKGQSASPDERGDVRNETS